MQKSRQFNLSANWFNAIPGQKLAQLESTFLTRVLNQEVAGYMLCLGLYEHLSGSLPTARGGCYQILPTKSGSNKSSLLIADYTALPLQDNSIDVIILNHVLENCDNPQAILKEVYRVLAPEGYLAIFAFNPYSLWQIYRYFKATSLPTEDMLTRLWSARKLSDELQSIGFSIEQQSTLFFRPPITNEKLLRDMYFFELLGQLCWPGFGADIAMIARKKTIIVTPLHIMIKRWWQKLSKPLAQPVVGN